MLPPVLGGATVAAAGVIVAALGRWAAGFDSGDGEPLLGLSLGLSLAIASAFDLVLAVVGGALPLLVARRLRRAEQLGSVVVVTLLVAAIAVGAAVDTARVALIAASCITGGVVGLPVLLRLSRLQPFQFFVARTRGLPWFVRALVVAPSVMAMVLLVPWVVVPVLAWESVKALRSAPGRGLPVAEAGGRGGDS